MQWDTLAVGVVYRRDLDGRPGARAGRHRPRPARRRRRPGPRRGGRWSLVVLVLAMIQAVVRASCGTGWRSTNWLAPRSARCSCSAGTAPWSASRSGGGCPPARSSPPRPTTPCCIGGAFDVTARLAGAIVSYAVVAVILLLHTSVAARAVVLVGVPAMVLLLGPLLRPLQRRQARPARGRRSADLARRRHGRRAAGAARHRRRAGVPHPLPHAVPRAARAGVHVAVAAGHPGLGPGAAARHLPGASSPGSAPGSRSRARSTSATSSRSTATRSSWSCPIRTAVEAADKMTRSLRRRQAHRRRPA